jgi:tetratricopeptide (TPR) repeat protein
VRHLLVLLLVSVMPASAAPAPSAKKAKPAVTEAARRAFVKANAVMGDAKTAGDYADAAKYYEEASAAAPAWPDPQFNLAKARELRGDFAGAIKSLEKYIALGGADVREAQDLIYVLETKRDRAGKTAARKLRIQCAALRTTDSGTHQSWFEVDGASAAFVDRSENSEAWRAKMAALNVAVKPVQESRDAYVPDPSDPDHFTGGEPGQPRAHAKLIDGGARVKLWTETADYSEANPYNICPITR